MEKNIFEYSMKNIKMPENKIYVLELLGKIYILIRRIKWKDKTRKKQPACNMTACGRTIMAWVNAVN